MLRLRGGDSERGSGIQEETRDLDWKGTNEKGDCRGTTWQRRQEAIIEKGNRA